MARSLSVFVCVMLIASCAFAGKRYASSGAQGGGNGTTMQDAWTMAEAIANAQVRSGSGDTVYFEGGTYSTRIVPTHSGTLASPIVFRPYSAAVCSLYTTTGPAVTVSSINYFEVIGFRIRQAASVWNHTITISSSTGWALIQCRIYGGGTHNTGTQGDWPSVYFADAQYGRMLRCFHDREDIDITDDAYRGDAVGLHGDSYNNIFEEDTVVRCSHYAFAIPYGPASMDTHDSYNIVRNCVAYNSHVGLGNTDVARRCLYEGNRIFAPGQVNTYRGGNALEMSSRTSIYRYMMVYDDSSSYGANHGHNPEQVSSFMSQSTYAKQEDNRVYHNGFLGFTRTTGNPTGDNKDVYNLWMDDASYGSTYYSMKGDVWKNNIMAYHQVYSGSYLIYQRFHGTTPYDTMDNNITYGNVPGEVIVQYNLGAYNSKSNYSYTLAQAKSNFPNTWKSTNMDRSPMLVDSVTNIRLNRSFEISATSPCVNAAIPLTYTVGSASSGQKVIHVRDASYFVWQWGRNPWNLGDSIDVGGERCQIDSIDYAANNICVKTNLTSTHANGVGIFVTATYTTLHGYVSRLGGSMTDIGPYELNAGTGSGGGGTGGGTPLTDTVSVVTATYGSTQAQPTILRWHPVVGATKYWLSVSVDHWSSLIINNSAITDTFYIAGGLPASTLVQWNVAAGNADGWSVSPTGGSPYWNTDWIYYTAAPAQAMDVYVDWNMLGTTKTMTGDTRVLMTNVQRVSTYLVLRNPLKYTLTWPTNITWQGLSSPPALTDTLGAFLFLRDSTRVLGFNLTAFINAGVTAGYLNTLLANYVQKGVDITISHTNGKFILKLGKDGDPAWLTLDENQNLVLHDFNGEATLAQLIAGNGGGTRLDSTTICIAQLDSAWMSYYGTRGVTPVVNFPKSFRVDSLMISVSGTGSDAITCDVRFGVDVPASSGGTALVTSPASNAQATTWYKVVPNNAVIPAYNSIWTRITGLVGHPTRASIQLKGRWISQ